jgi:hypothetical protein
MCLAPKVPTPQPAPAMPTPPPPPPAPPDPPTQNEQQLKDQQSSNINRAGRQSLMIPLNPLGGTAPTNGLNIPG